MFLSPSVWHYIETEVFIDGSTGFVRVYKEGAYVATFDGNTQQQGSADLTHIRLLRHGRHQRLPAELPLGRHLRDRRPTRLGESRVKTLYPDGATADADWTPSGGGDNDEMVDETLVNGDTDYVASATPGDLDICTLGDLEFTPDTVHAVQMTMCARKDDAETREVRLKLKSGAVTEDRTTQAMAGSYQYFSEVYEEDRTSRGHGRPPQSMPRRSASRW